MRTLAAVLYFLVITILAGPAYPEEGSAPPSMDMEQAREKARKNNRTLRAAREALYQSELVIDKAWTMVQPQINAVGTYTHSAPAATLSFPDQQSLFDNMDINPFSDPDICGGEFMCIDWANVDFMRTDIIKRDSFGLTATLTQPLFIGQALTTIKNAYNIYDLAKLNTENLEDYLLYSVEVTYYGALAAKKIQVSADKAVELRQEHLKVAQAKFQVGDQPKITVLRAEIDANQAEQDAKQAEKSLQLAKEAISLLVGCDPDFELVEPAPAKRPGQSLDIFLGKATDNRRDMLAAQMSLTIAEKMKDDAWMRFLPSLALTGMFRVTDTKGFTDEYYNWNVGLALSLPIYDGGMRYTALEEARSKIREAQIKIEDKRLAIRSEVRQLWLKMEMAEANLEKAQKALELAEEQAHLSKISFDAGAITNLEVLDANHLLFLSEINVAQLELQLQLAILAIQKSVRMFNPAGAMTAGSGSNQPAAQASTGAGASMSANRPAGM